jgi:hypothetical protein
MTPKDYGCNCAACPFAKKGQPSNFVPPVELRSPIGVVFADVATRDDGRGGEPMPKGSLVGKEWDATLAQAGVYPVDVQIEIHINALDRSDNYMLDPLSEAAETALAELTGLNDRLVWVHGQTIGDTETRQEGDRVTRIISATVHASLK